MVCSIGSGRMVTMARLLESGSVPQTVTDEASRWTLAAQYIHRELRDADEANLLDEEDMHIFDLKPMTDRLNLVCCNSCKKPVKASRYKDHAELCQSLISAKESIPELGGDMGHKKPPRKERKKLLTNATAVGELERFRTTDGDDNGASDTHLDEQTHMTSSYTEAKGSALCVDGAILMDGSVLSKGNTELYAGVKPPTTKRSKLIAAESPLISDDIETASGVTKSLFISTQEAITYGDYPNNPRVRSQKIHDNQIPENINYGYIQGKGKSDIPAPLAAKIFYSQRNHRLRSALTHMYYNSSTNEHVQSLDSATLVHGNGMPSWTPSPNNLSHQQGERDKHLLPSLLKAEQILAQSSEGVRACPPILNFASQYPVNKVLGSHRTPAGTIGSNCISNPYSLSGNSGMPLGTMQQTKGSVPVV